MQELKGFAYIYIKALGFYCIKKLGKDFGPAELSDERIVHHQRFIILNYIQSHVFILAYLY